MDMRLGFKSGVSVMGNAREPRVPITASLSASQPDPGATDWAHHEHVSETTHGQAQQLIESAGSAELAKHAIEIADHQWAGGRSSEERSAADAQSELARALGYASYLDLMESSKQAGTGRDRHWLVTAVADGRWALWNDVDFEIHQLFDSQQAALAAAGIQKKPK
jgi:hypothetical protein